MHFGRCSPSATSSALEKLTCEEDGDGENSMVNTSLLPRLPSPSFLPEAGDERTPSATLGVPVLFCVHVAPVLRERPGSRQLRLSSRSISTRAFRTACTARVTSLMRLCNNSCGARIMCYFISATIRICRVLVTFSGTYTIRGSGCSLPSSSVR